MFNDRKIKKYERSVLKLNLTLEQRRKFRIDEMLKLGYASQQQSKMKLNVNRKTKIQHKSNVFSEFKRLRINVETYIFFFEYGYSNLIPL